MATTRDRDRRGTRAGLVAKDAWYHKPEGDKHTAVIQRCRRIVQGQWELYDRLIKLGALYDPNGWAAKTATAVPGRGAVPGRVIENVIASNVDAVTGSITSQSVRGRIMTSGGDWSEQRRARHLELYGEELEKLPKVAIAKHRVTSVREAAAKGTSVIRVMENAYDEVEASHPCIDDIILDEGALQPDGWPLEMFQRLRIDRDELCARYPKKADEIRRRATAHSSISGTGGTWMTRWFDDGRMERNQIALIEGWRRPVGRKGRKGYQPGCHVLVADGIDVFEEPWEENYFPFARFVWIEREGLFFGIGGGERIAGHQGRLNKHNWQFDCTLDHHAVPTTYVRPVDANIGTVTRNPAGTWVTVKGDWPQTVVPNPISPALYTRHHDLQEGAYNYFGQSRMSATGMKPAGLDSGAALREYKDQTTDVFSTQDEGAEDHHLDALWLAFMACKRLAKKGKAPTLSRKTTWGRVPIKWADVDMELTRAQMQAASTLARTPAGRTQFALELAQGGVISQDDARRLLLQPDTDRALSLYTASLENIERALEDMLDGRVVMPNPFMNLRMCVWRGQAQLNLAETQGAPERVLENIRNFVVVAAHYVSIADQGAAANANAGAPVGAAEAAPPMPGAPPMEGMPTSALAPEAALAVA